MLGNVLIFLCGLLLYAGYGLAGLACLLAAGAVTFACGLGARRSKGLMWLGILLNAGLLITCKVVPYTPLGWAAPLGVSYYVMQNIAYLADVARGKYPAERNLFRYGLYITYFPHLFIGPIERYDAMAATLFARRRLTWQGIADGGMQVLWGLCKKLILAGRAGILVQACAAHTRGGAFALAALVGYSLQLYADFSGGTDVVLGVSRMLGIRMTDNFDAPYRAQSVKEFWQRWHITLGSWLRDYIYIPLGGNRKGKVRRALNTLVTFLVSGLWHGVQYVLWGLCNGLLVLVGDRLRTKYRTLNRAGVFVCITLLWAFFVWPTAGQALHYAGSLFRVFNYGELVAALPQMGLTLGDYMVLGAAVAALFVLDARRRQLRNRLRALTPAAKAAVLCTLALLVLVFGVYGIGFDAAAFIYSRF